MVLDKPLKEAIAKMFPRYGYMPGPEYGPSQSQMHMDPSGTPGRFDYSAYYSSKGQTTSHYGGMAAAASHPYGGKPRNMTGPEAMYGQNWSSMMQGAGYMGAPGSKAGMANPYAMQVGHVRAPLMIVYHALGHICVSV